MKRRPIALKLLLLAGVPVLVALLLASLVVGNARAQLRRSEALGSVEDLAELSENVSSLVYRLEAERARLALELGVLGGARDGGRVASPELSRLVAPDTLAPVFNGTDEAALVLKSFFERRDRSRLPGRLTNGLLTALAHLSHVAERRRAATQGTGDLDELLEYYAVAVRQLIRSTAALSELTDDGELLRSMSALVAVLELEERASSEHALLAYVFATGDFPPGSFRNLMTVLTEERTFMEVLKTNATASEFSDYEQRLRDPRLGKADAMRALAVDSSEGELTANAVEWFELQGAKVDALRRFEERLNRDVHERALTKLGDTQRAFVTSSVLAGSALVGSVLLALFVGRGVTRSVTALKEAAQHVAMGVTDVRVELKSKDELETLGHAFNEMTGELARARDALREQARMARDLEIAAGIQAALLPPSLAHPEFEFAGRMRPADEVGGDFYDVLSDERSRALWITIGDVSGHGVPAGLVMLMTQSAFAAYFRANPLARPDEVIRGVNDLLNEQIGVRLRDNKYVTGLLLAHAGGGRFVFAGAHEWPLVWRAQTGKAELIEAPGPWLGINRDLADIPVSSLHLGPGDVLCLYSDGLIESRNAAGALFDVDGLGQALERAARAGRQLSDIADSVIGSVAEYAREREDDWTLLLIRRAGTPAAERHA